MALFGNLFSKDNRDNLDRGLKKSKENFFSKLSRSLVGKSVVDAEVLDQLEEILITSDVGVDTTLKIIHRLEERVARDKYLGAGELDQILREEISGLIGARKPDSSPFEIPAQHHPHVIMVVGVNGVGKTTTIGKLSAQYVKQGKKVLLGAADTFRAAAVDQLKLWGERVNVPVIALGMNTDPSAVAYEAVKEGVRQGVDVIIIDTAGRLHTKVNLMNELQKVRRVIQKVVMDGPHEVLLVLDGSTGQNAVIQAREFTKATQVTGLVITKLDGTAKGGVVLGIVDEFNIPVKFIGIGEKVEDLIGFDQEVFIESLFGKK